MPSVELTREEARIALEAVENLRKEVVGEIISGRRGKRQEERLERYNKLSDVELRLGEIFEEETLEEE